MTRKECLDAAAACVLKDRNNSYGGPEDSFGVIANLWSVYLGRKVYPADVAMMMSLLKIARIKGNQGYADGYVDLAGYAACGAECAMPECDAEPIFRPGDRVQYRVELPSVSDWIWRDATYLRRAFSWQQSDEHIVSSDDLGPVTVKDKDLRPAPKAEGCEELVQKDLHEDCEGCLYKTYADSHAEEHDAPQTPGETCQRIVDSNPATYGQPRKPTGEELAEMAEEEKRG